MRVLDLFCGAGGFTIGLQQAGMEVVMAVDAWQDAVNCHNRNNIPGCHAICMDVVEHEDLIVRAAIDGKVDCVVGGPPCQDFSTANRLKNDALPRAKLTVQYARIVEQIRPPWFIMENVPQAGTSPEYNEARLILEGAGYEIMAGVYCAADYGVPQIRNRMIAIGRLGSFPPELMLFKRPLPGVVPRVGVKQYLEGLGHSFPHEFYFRPPVNAHNSRCIFRADEPAPTVRAQHHYLPKPGSKLRIYHPGNAAGYDDAYDLNTQEIGALQGFPLDYDWGAVSNACKMIGNAIPTCLAKAAGRFVMEYEHEAG